MAKYYKGDHGTIILVDVKEDIRTATSLVLKVKKPNATATVDWVGTLSGITKIKYIVKSKDWNVAGTYKLQAYVVMPGWVGRGDTTSFVIEEPL